MKKILVACGSGIVTSTTVLTKLKKFLDDNGYEGKYKVNQIKTTEAVSKQDGADFLISTTMKPVGLNIDYVSGIPFLTGQNIEQAKKEILELMEK